jgi:hypothetical protein
MVTDTSTGAVTVSTVEFVTGPRVAEMVLVPWLRLVARPFELIVATAVTEAPQITEADISLVLASAKVPVAVNCWVLPSGTEGLAGVTVNDTKADPATVKTVEPEMLPNTAEMVLVPKSLLIARPLESIVATAVADELQVTDAEMSFVLASE